jgi:hypothetical protein
MALVNSVELGCISMQAKVARVQSGSNKDCADTTLPFFIVATIPEVLLHVSFQPHIIVWGS